MTRFLLYRGEDLLGTITEEGEDFPWHDGKFEPDPTFKDIKPLFDEELSLLAKKKIEKWGATWEKIERLGLRLEPIDGGKTISKFLIHIKGKNAWWRF